MMVRDDDGGTCLNIYTNEYDDDNTVVELFIITDNKRSDAFLDFTHNYTIYERNYSELIKHRFYNIP